MAVVQEEEAVECGGSVDEFGGRRMLYLKQPRVFESMELCVLEHWWFSGFSSW